MKNSIDIDISEKKALYYTFSTGVTIHSNMTEQNEDINSGKFNLNAKNATDKHVYEDLEKCLNAYKDVFCNTALYEYIEDGYISDSQKLYSRISKEYGAVVAGMFLNEIYKHNALNKKIVKSILFVMGSTNPQSFRGAEEGILAYALLNQDYEIKDLALQCYEKWDDREYLTLLKSMTIGVDFLDEYLGNIIRQLEGE